MNVRLLPILLGAIVLSSCAEIQLSRMKPELEKDIRAGRMEKAAATETEMLEVADRGFGPQSVDATRTRVALAKSYAQWKLTDRALALAQQTVDRLDPTAVGWYYHCRVERGEEREWPPSPCSCSSART